jgi:hypothetical protein
VIANAVLEAVGFRAEPGATPRIKGGLLVSGNYFHVLGVEPRLGRGFREDEDQAPGRDAVVVLGPDDSPERHGLHGDKCGSGEFPGDADLRASRLLHAAGNGSGVFDSVSSPFQAEATH